MISWFRFFDLKKLTWRNVRTVPSYQYYHATKYLVIETFYVRLVAPPSTRLEVINRKKVYSILSHCVLTCCMTCMTLLDVNKIVSYYFVNDCINTNILGCSYVTCLRCMRNHYFLNWLWAQSSLTHVCAAFYMFSINRKRKVQSLWLMVIRTIFAFFVEFCA
jgi:hypothetical protein